MQLISPPVYLSPSQWARQFPEELQHAAETNQLNKILQEIGN